MTGSDGELVRRGRFRFLILTQEQDLRCFWLEQDGIVPDSTWGALTDEQRSHLAMDPRNGAFREDLDRRHREEWLARRQG